jgi:Na+-translocating ferredoxin:NAD+ oxidoreductase RNF subunit RnfB
MYEILERITSGKGEADDIERLETLAESIKASALCALGQTAPNPVLSTLHFFRDEYEAHVNEKRCPVGACKEMLDVVIDPAMCKGCALCIKECPVDAISGEKKAAHVIDTEKCIKCGACIKKCPFKAISM